MSRSAAGGEQREPSVRCRSKFDGSTTTTAMSQQHYLEIIVKAVLSPTTLMCPLQGAVSSTRSTSEPHPPATE
jgi:hypothetical protein